MLVLPLRAAGDRYGVRCTDVVEVLPALQVRRLPHAPAYLAGLFTYRGAMTAAVDLGLLFGGAKVRPALSTRMVIVRCSAGKIGLFAEDVGAPSELERDAFGAGQVSVKDAPYLGDVVSVDGQVLQLIEVEKVVSAELRSMVFGES